MKKLLILTLSVILSTFGGVVMETQAQSSSKKVATVYYFHSTNRCATCNANQTENNYYFGSKIF